MRILLPFVLTMSLAVPLAAQDTHVFYDLFTDSIRYERDGKALKHPRFRKGDRVVVHFTEFNPYLFSAASDVISELDPAASAPTDGLAGASPLSMLMPGFMGGGGMMPGLSSMFGSDTSGGGVLAFMDKPLLSLGSTSFRLNDLFSSKDGSRGADELALAQAQLAELARLQAEMQAVYTEINEAKLAVAASAMAAPFFENVVRDPELRPSLIKKMGREYASMIYPGKEPSQLEVRDAFTWQSRAAQHQQLLGELASLRSEYAQKAAATQQTARQLEGFAEQMGNDGLSQFSSDLLALGRQNTGFQKSLDRYLASQSGDGAAPSPALSTAELLAQQVQFRELASQKFSYETVVHLNSDVTVLTTTFSQLDSTGAVARTQQGPGGKTKIVRLETAGGVRFASGLGLSFGGFDGGGAKEYSVRDGTITAEDGEQFQPMLSSFMHIFPRARGRASLGGSFGVGIPLGGSAIQMPHFFFGPSLFFGGGQKLSLTGGLMLGPTKKLGRGLAVGDPFDLNLAGEIPTNSRYSAGWFVGFSFNLVR